ncbi:hypothetical protein GLOTRDRAFT_98775 [Gloeophyllum trabeum ATCC 11539]|uniref:Uncharacterized protein n=1 Tax=Gloeophyllum trabeum (strain ATCC 11539 / FP-39264 / Madison 617) TaxID=670483 RepID=S7QFX1_GLOTA|nr:uncharacterized protein GLOTRDRAFT_98775 [Gloeophyllum trabeum ATCC 11539]EPQ58053.1 hypothetical protein GLOTRDRAFT_98775 [Gloeophyllum trabeum ATCC 11539]
MENASSRPYGDPECVHEEKSMTCSERMQVSMAPVTTPLSIALIFIFPFNVAVTCVV